MKTIAGLIYLVLGIAAIVQASFAALTLAVTFAAFYAVIYLLGI